MNADIPVSAIKSAVEALVREDAANAHTGKQDVRKDVIMLLMQIIVLVEHKRDKAPSEDAAIFYEGYEAAYHDLLLALDVSAQEISDYYIDATRKQEEKKA